MFNENSKTMKTIEELDNEIKELRCQIEALQIKMDGLFKVSLGSCDRCGCQPTTLYLTETGKFCKDCKPSSNP